MDTNLNKEIGCYNMDVTRNTDLLCLVFLLEGTAFCSDKTPKLIRKTVTDKNLEKAF